MSVAGHALWLDLALLQCFEQGAAWLAVMLAVAEATVPQQLLELDETGLDVKAAYVAQAER